MQPSDIQHVLNRDDINRAQELIQHIYVDEKITDYIINIVFATRDPQAYHLGTIAHYIEQGVSPRATLALHHAARAQAFLKQRHFVTPDDVKAVCYAILRHRLTLTYEAEAAKMSPDDIITSLLNIISAP